MEWRSWAAEQPKPELSLDVPTATRGRVSVVATSNAGTTVYVYTNGDLLTKAGQRVSTGISLEDGIHDIRAESCWCFSPDREELKQFGETCTCAFDGRNVKVDSTAPVLHTEIHESNEGYFVVEGAVEDSSPATVTVGQQRVAVTEGKFSLPIPYSIKALPLELIEVCAKDELGSQICTNVTIPHPNDYWVKYDSSGVLLEFIVRADFDPKPNPFLLGYGTDEWVHYIGGEIAGGWDTPTEFYIGLGIAGLVVLMGGAAALVWTVTMPGRRLAKTIQTRIEASLPPPAEQLALPPAVAALLSDFALRHPDAAGQLELFLTERQEQLLLQEGGEHA